MYLMIQNIGEAPVEGYTLLGMSTARNSDTAGVIGKFGSGTKHAINLLLRHGIGFTIYCGKVRLEFFYENEKIEDGLGGTETSRVKCRRTKNGSSKTIDCGWCLDFGAMDWTDIHMGLREFVSNAIDRTLREKGTFQDPSLVVEKVADKRAKAGFTRIYINLNPQVHDFFKRLDYYFLHFATPEFVGKTFLPKNPASVGPVIYREGVFVRELPARCPAVFDYNFSDSQIQIDECRNSSEYALRGSIAQLINAAKPKVLKQLFIEMEDGDVYEAGLDDWYLGYHVSDAIKDSWNQAWKDYAGDAVVASTEIASSAVANHAQKKGHKVKAIKSDAVRRVAEKMGVPTVADAIGDHAVKGRVECEPTLEAIDALTVVWGWLCDNQMTNGKPHPQVKCFRQLMDGESETLGYYVMGSDTVFIREDVGGKLALKTMLEEVGHYVTGSEDNSRDFQQFFIDLAVEALSHVTEA